MQHLAAYPYPIIASELVKTILVKNYFYRIRMEAAKALINVSVALHGCADEAVFQCRRRVLGTFLPAESVSAAV